MNIKDRTPAQARRFDPTPQRVGSVASTVVGCLGTIVLAILAMALMKQFSIVGLIIVALWLISRCSRFRPSL
ncbi:MAG: hypothetical protein RMM29_08420 [Planctomycetota bacterium]|nr:hypothetical protein [Planctomycetota bacterium]MCX8039360.1 hypothetical protein [Planctomycetota bacterium]MDW8373651.1 hypothetical protein [Planctomycetota bacterium]